MVRGTTTEDDGRARGGEAARMAEELAARESSGGAAARKNYGGVATRESCGGARDGCGGARDSCSSTRGSCGGGEGAAALENLVRRRLGFGARRIEKKTATDVR
jgi:hypothetical protein